MHALVGEWTPLYVCMILQAYGRDGGQVAPKPCVHVGPAIHLGPFNFILLIKKEHERKKY